jgi:integrase
MATIKLFTKTVSKDKLALVPIYIRIRYGRGIDIVQKTGFNIKAENWSNENQQPRRKADIFEFKSGNSDHKETGRQNFADQVKALRDIVERELMVANKADVNSGWLQLIIDKYWNPEKYQITLFSFAENFIEKSKTKPNNKTGRPVSYKMRREYQVTFDYLKEYSRTNNKVIDFKDIDIEFYDSFIQFLQKKSLAVNTIGKKIQTLKIFLNAAKEENKNPYEAYKSRRFEALTENAETIYLNEQELQTIYKHDFSESPRLDRVRDLFLVGCWTGCRFSDLAQVKPENITDGLIEVKQAKTDKKVLIPLHPVVTSILNKYKGDLPEPISNQKFNVALKEVAELAKIKDPVHKAITKGGVKTSKLYKKHELVTTHTARRSFATNLYKSGFPSLSIMAITGHTTEESFLKYIKVTPDEHAKKLQDHWGKINLKVV